MLWHLKGNGTKQLGHAKMDGTAKHKRARTTHWEHSLVSTRIWNAQQKYIPIRYIVSKWIAFDFQAGVTWDLKKRLPTFANGIHNWTHKCWAMCWCYSRCMWMIPCGDISTWNLFDIHPCPKGMSTSDCVPNNLDTVICFLKHSKYATCHNLRFT